LDNWRICSIFRIGHRAIWLKERKKERTEERIKERKKERTEERIKERKKERTEERIKERKKERMKAFFFNNLFP
jgi:hypothetical protein